MQIDFERLRRIAESVRENRGALKDLAVKIKDLFLNLGGAYRTGDKQVAGRLLAELMPLVIEEAVRKDERIVILINDVKYKPGERPFPNNDSHSDGNKLDGTSHMVFSLCKQAGLKPYLEYWADYDRHHPNDGWMLVVPLNFLEIQAEAKNYRGLPENYNPFLVVVDGAVDDDTLPNIAPDYFYFSSGADLPFARPTVKADSLSQAEAEELVRKVASEDPKRNFAVKEECAHIIPSDLRNIVRVAKVQVDMFYDGGSCRAEDCYYLKQ